METVVLDATVTASWRSVPEPATTPPSGAGSHVGGENVVGMPVEILAGSVVTHRGPGVGVPGSDLHVAQVHACIEHGRDRGYLYLILKSAW